MKLRWKILVATGVFVVLIAASLSVTMHVQPANELEAYKKVLRDKGEKLELSEVLPPPVAPEDNSVDAVENAFRMFGSGIDNVPSEMTMVAPGKAMIGWIQPDARGYDFTNSWDDFATNIAADGPALELLHQVLERPKLDFNMDYTDTKKSMSSLVAHLAPLKRSVLKLGAAAIYELHEGDGDAAVTNILTALVLIHNDAAEGLLISHLVRIAMTAIAVPPTWELLQATNVTDAQLAIVQKGWEQINFVNDAKSTFVMERIYSATIIQKSRGSHDGFIELFGSTVTGGGLSGGGSTWPDVLEDLTEGPRAGIAETMWRSSWSYSEELYMLKNEQIILETLRTMETNQSGFYKGDYDAMLAHLSLFGLTNAGEGFFSALRIPDLGEYYRDPDLAHVVGKTLQIETARRVVIAAIALKRFQLKYGKWPETLDELTWEFLQSVPVDPYDGKILKYHPNADGTYLLYSVGEDGIDDGGDPTNTGSGNYLFYWQSPKAHDWVWPQPATPAEVQNFYEHPPK